MNQDHGLPSDVVSAIHAGRKIDAIKLLRESSGLGLKEAKDEVDAYLRKHPSIQPPKPNYNGLLFFIVLLLLGFIVYQLLS